MDLIGADRILLGSDWPFPMGASSAEHDLAHLDISLKRKIRKTNAEDVFGLRLSARARSDSLDTLT
jgi:aminocarboxymuconate-semialdehyde decarboxylase